MSEKKLIWVDESVAKVYEQMESDVSKMNLINKVIEDRKIDISNDIQNLSDDLIRFKAFAIDYSKSFKEAYQLQSENLEKVWEEQRDKFEDTERKIYKAAKEVKNLKEKVDELNKSLDSISTHKVERLISVIEKFNSMSSSDKEIFRMILKIKDLDEL